MVLRQVSEIERLSKAVALAGTYEADTGAASLPKVSVALMGFFPRASDPSAIKRRMLLGPARVNVAAAWRQFCETDGVP